MNGRITIDGYLRDGNYELIHHGGKPNPEAVCSLIYDYRYTEETTDLLHMMKNSLGREIETMKDLKLEEAKRRKINSCLSKEGLPVLTQKQFNVIFDKLDIESEDDD